MLWLIFRHFFLLGCVSFGGPAAHLGYFKRRFVDELNWLSEEDYAQIVALSQFLPGPGSSQTGFAIGYQKAGVAGGIAAFLAFTSPSILIMILLASFGSVFTETGWYQGIIHGLKLLAVVVVADATFGMFKSFCQCKVSQILCVLTAMAVLLVSSITTQIAALFICGIVGVWQLSQASTEQQKPFGGKTQILPLIVFAGLLLGLPLLAHLHVGLQISHAFYSAGSLVFGGGHVVLPLLQNMLGGSVSNDVFLTGYAAAQAVPGPMFTMVTWLGFHLLPYYPISGALLATFMVFLPGFLLVVGLLRYWQALALNPKLKGAVNGINASVTGLLLAALYQPVFSSAVLVPLDLALVLFGMLLLKSLKLPIIGLVGFYILAGAFIF